MPTRNSSLQDPDLTELGVQQCQTLERHLKELPLLQDAELIVSSPMRRTLQTAQTSLAWLFEKGVPAECWGEWQEASTKPCDTGTPIDRFRDEFPLFDFTNVYKEWPRKRGLYAFSKEAILARGKSCRLWLKNRPEKVIVVVSHSQFLRTGVTSDWIFHADYRIYTFTGTEDGMVESTNTKEKGGGMGTSWKEPYIPKPGDFELKKDEVPSPLAVGETLDQAPN